MVYTLTQENKKKSKKVNIIISTYPASIRSAIGSSKLYKQSIKTNNYLTLCLINLNKFSNFFDEIIIPKIKPNKNDIKRYGKKKYTNLFNKYYNLKSLDDLNIYKKIKFIEMENHGNSYFQFLNASKLFIDKSEYLFFLEDDYIINNLNFLKLALKKLSSNKNKGYVCCGLRSFNYDLNQDNIGYHKSLLKIYDFKKLAHGEHASHSIGIIHTKEIKKLFNTKSFIYLTKSVVDGSIAQTKFSYMLLNLNIPIIELENDVHNIFWETYYYTMVSFGNKNKLPSIVPVQYLLSNLTKIHIKDYDFFINSIDLLLKVSVLNNIYADTLNYEVKSSLYGQTNITKNTIIQDYFKNIYISSREILKWLWFYTIRSILNFSSHIYLILKNKSLSSQIHKKKYKKRSIFNDFIFYLKFWLFSLNPFSIFGYFVKKIFILFKHSYSARLHLGNLNNYRSIYKKKINLNKKYNYFIFLYSIDKNLKIKFKNNYAYNFLKKYEHFSLLFKKLNLKNTFIFDLRKLPTEDYNFYILKYYKIQNIKDKHGIIKSKRY